MVRNNADAGTTFYFRLPELCLADIISSENQRKNVQMT